MSKELATLAGGCFWCTEAIFKRIKGVEKVTSGYTGGDIPNPAYEQVCSGQTGHAECIQIEFNPEVISFEKLLEIFWRLHDPTTLNRQGADVGTQYRSAIFYHSEEQRLKAIESKKKIENKKLYKDQIVTKIEKFRKFYPAEEYHQDFYDSNRGYGYCNLIIDPKVHKLIEMFNGEVKEEYQNSY